ncbi:hypothetical protein PHYC_00071 [Phycisphaerales bacterium]|nr:hypothetical protein PHYC_00071 [Phycisphaerales bacterium]
MLDLATNNPIETLRLYAAALSLGLLHSEDLPTIADRALSDGVYSDSLAELANTANPMMSEVGPLFRAAFAELGIGPMPRKDAAWLLTRRCVQLLLDESRPPRQTLTVLRMIVDAARDVLPDFEYCGSGLDVGRLYAYSWSYDEPNENCFEGRIITSEVKRHAILDHNTRMEAREWLERHP